MIVALYNDFGPIEVYASWFFMRRMGGAPLLRVVCYYDPGQERRNTMLDLRRARIHSTGNSSGNSVSRRIFLRDLSLFSLAALAGSSLLHACKPPSAQPGATPVVPQAEKPIAALSAESQMTVMEALKNRKSASSFQTQPLPREMLLELLWAAWGINRPDSGKRTAPSAMNAQEIDIYVLLPDGAFVYDAKNNQLSTVLAEDIRTKAGTRGFIAEAPVQLLFVADHTKLRVGSQAEKETLSACHTGFIGQNVYLYCASHGLAARFYAGLDRASLADSLKLREGQAIVFGQAVGYP
jgi:nitroreductase